MTTMPLHLYYFFEPAGKGPMIPASKQNRILKKNIDLTLK